MSFIICSKLLELTNVLKRDAKKEKKKLIIRQNSHWK